MNEQLERLVGIVKSVVTAAVSGRETQECIGENKIVLVVNKDEVSIKVVAPVVREKKPSRLAPEFVQKIQEAKKTLKGKRDAMYLFTLLMSLSSELKKLKLGKMDAQSRSIIIPAMNIVEQAIVKQVEVK